MRAPVYSLLFSLSLSFFLSAACRAQEGIDGKRQSDSYRQLSLTGGGSHSWDEGIQAALQAREYYASRSDRGLQAPNRAQNFRTTFHEDGIELAPRQGSSSAEAMRWRTLAWGREGKLEAPGNALLSHVRTRVEYAYRDGLVEWYENRPEGLEQGFRIATRPEGWGELNIVGAVPRDLHPQVSADRQVIDFADRTGATVCRFTALKVVDVTAREIPSHFTATPGEVRIVIDDRGATYPLFVDPLMTTPAWTSSGGFDGGNNMLFGLSVGTAGDVNGDGYSDVIIGAPAYDNGHLDEGRVFVWYGSAVGLGEDGTPDNVDWIAESNQDDASFGQMVATAGDVNGDGFSDVIVGAAQYDNGQQTEGSVFLWYGSASGLGPNGTPDNADWRSESDQENANLMQAGTAGDVNGDGYDEVIVGTGWYDVAGGPQGANHGIALLWYGSTDGLKPNGIPANADWMIQSDRSGAFFGDHVATAGDVNGDGFADVIVGADRYSAGGNVFVWYGSASGLGPSGIPQDADWIAESERAGGRFGRGRSAGDVNGDHYDDIIVGARSLTNGEGFEGGAFLWNGSESGLGPSGTLANADWSCESNEEHASLGSSLGTAGDVNADGYSDVIIGAPSYNPTSPPIGPGAAFVWYGSALGLGPNGIPQNADWVDSGKDDSGFGISVGTAGDVNGDGFSDVIVSDVGTDIGVGYAYVYHGGVDQVAIGEPMEVPAGIRLVELRPNPFNSHALIDYEVQTPGLAQLAIYDVAGRHVTTLVRGWVEPDRHTIAWDGRDQSGAPLPAGAYFIRLDAGGEMQMAKITLTR